MSKRNRISLTGADKFMLALEPEHQFEGTTGNTCKYVLELNGRFHVPNFIQEVRENEVALQLAECYIHPSRGNKNYWSHHFNHQIPFSVFEDCSVEEILFKRQLDKHKGPLFGFDIIVNKENTPDETTVIIFSWHHLLMDGYGAVLFLKNLVSPIEVQPIVPKRFRFNLNTLKKMIKVKKYITKSSSGNIATTTSNAEKKVIPHYFNSAFSEEETRKIEQNALKHGAKFGIGSYLLACTAQQIMTTDILPEFTKKHDAWVPVPHDMRKKGDTWPIIGNYLSFVYYRISGNTIDSAETTVRSINEQLLHQIKHNLPEANAHLMHYLKKLPLTIYRRLIKGKNRKSLASFLFTVAAEHPSDFNTFFDCPITNAYSVPPNTNPPGLVVAFNRFEDKISIVVQSYEHAVKREQLADLAHSIRINLLK